jgi:hypothetical protein
MEYIIIDKELGEFKYIFLKNKFRTFTVHISLFYIVQLVYTNY